MLRLGPQSLIHNKIIVQYRPQVLSRTFALLRFAIVTAVPKHYSSMSQQANRDYTAKLEIQKLLLKYLLNSFRVQPRSIRFQNPLLALSSVVLLPTLCVHTTQLRIRR